MTSGSGSGSGRDKRIELGAMALLDEALELPSADQKRFIESRTDVAADIREHALALLTSDQRGRLSIRTGGAGGALDDDNAPPPVLPGYRIIRQLGRGGMGAVYLADRDGSDFRHEVAIKIIKPGVLQDSLVDRFRRERQILAQLNHPHIAHLHDGGETADGQPYIIMEYISGQTLREWLGDAAQPLAKRLDLFRQIADAVEFAHQNLVIHRDLTPNNVLVTGQDQAKLIDFGIARPPVTESDPAAASNFIGLSLTPGFAAPERAKGLASNTLTDIFSLGRILGLMIERHDQPELAAIANRAAAHDFAMRYPSVSDLIDDVEDFRAGRPVAAFADGRRYRLGKFIRRERTLVGASAAVMLALVAGLVVAIWAYNRAEDAREVAEERFTQLRDLAHFQLFDLYDEMDHVVGNTSGRLALAQRSQDYLVSLANSRSDDASLQLETARGFLRLALIQGIPAHPNFGEPKLAGENLDRAAPIFRTLAAKGITAGNTGLAKMEAYRALWWAHSESQPDKAVQAIVRANQALARVPTDARDWEWMDTRRVIRLATLELADLEVDTDEIARSVELMAKDIGEWPAARRGGYEARFDQAVIENYRALVLSNRAAEDDGPYDNALLRQSLVKYLASDSLFAALERDFPNDPQTLYRRAWNAYYGYASASMLEDDPETERLLSQARTSVERLMTIEEADNSLDTFAERLREAQAQFLANLSRFDEAIPLMQQVIDGRRAKIKANRRPNPVSDLAFGQAIFGAMYRQAGMRAEACAAWTESEALMAELKRADTLQGYVEQLRPGMQRNLARCKAGEPVTAFTTLAGTE